MTAPGFFTQYSVGELGTAMRAGAYSPEQLVEHALAAVARLNPELNALVTVDPDGAREAALAAARELAAGVDRGPLHGIPVAVKDMVATKGLRTTMGSRHFSDYVPDQDAECVRALRAAGAIVLGKATTHEFAYGPFGDRSANGGAANPIRPDRMAGGSSAGSASAVAAGMVPLAVGTDTGGSVRIPSALCGVVGLRPTTGAISNAGVFPLSESLDAVGPIARTVEDCRLLWHALTGIEAPSERRQRPTELRIGWVHAADFGTVDPAVVSLTREKLAWLDAEVTDVRMPDPDGMHNAYYVIQGFEATRLHAERMVTAPELFDPEVLDRLRAATAVTEEHYRHAPAVRDEGLRAVNRLFAEHQLLAMPTVPIVAPPLGARSIMLGDQEITIREALLSLTTPWSVLGLPSISVPAGLVDGLPVGLQLVGPPGAEELVLSIAEELERSRQ